MYFQKIEEIKIIFEKCISNKMNKTIHNAVDAESLINCLHLSYESVQNTWNE